MLTLVLSAGDQEKGEMGLGAVPGRQAAFREGLEQAVLYAKALGCPRYPALPSLDGGAGSTEARSGGTAVGYRLWRQLFVFLLLVSFCMPCFQAHLIPGSHDGCWGLMRDFNKDEKAGSRVGVGGGQGGHLTLTRRKLFAESDAGTESGRPTHPLYRESYAIQARRLAGPEEGCVQLS